MCRSGPQRPSAIRHLGELRLFWAVRDVDALLAGPQRAQDDLADVLRAVRHHARPRLLTGLVAAAAELGCRDRRQHERHGDAVRLELPAGDRREHVDCGLGGGVRADAGQRHPGRAGADVDDSTRAPGAHSWQHGLGHGHEADHVELEHTGELVEIEPVEGRVQAHPGVVDQPVNPAVPVERRLNQPADGGGVGDVGRHGERAVELFAQYRQAIGAAGRQDGVCAGLVEQARRGRTDARRSTRDDDGAAGHVQNVHALMLADGLVQRGPVVVAGRCLPRARPRCGGKQANRVPQAGPGPPSRRLARCPGHVRRSLKNTPAHSPGQSRECQKASIPLTSARQVTGPTMPSTVTEGMSAWSACWKPRTAASVCGPKIPSTWIPVLGLPDRLRNWNSSCTPRTASPVLPSWTWTTSADQVCGPTIPSTPRWLRCWKARTAASVWAPKMPSTVTSCPRARSRYCRVRTGWCWSPRRTSGQGLTSWPGELGVVSYRGGMTTEGCLQFFATCWSSGGAQGRRPSPPAQGSRLETIAKALPTDPYTRSGSSRHAFPAAVCHIANSRSVLECSRNTTGSWKE